MSVRGLWRAIGAAVHQPGQGSCHLVQRDGFRLERVDCRAHERASHGNGKGEAAVAFLDDSLNHPRRRRAVGSARAAIGVAHEIAGTDVSCRAGRLDEFRPGFT